MNKVEQVLGTLGKYWGKLRARRILFGTVMSLVIGLTLTTSLVLAASLLSIPSRVQVVLSGGGGGGTSIAALTAYSDAAGTLPLASIDWGTVAVGTTPIKTIYLKNTGTASTTNVVLSTNGLTSGAITLTAPTSPVVIPVSATPTPITLTFTPGTTAGNVEDFNIILTY